MSADTKTVTALSNGVRVVIVRACAGERFFPARSGAVSPALSPDGRWLLVERIYPYEPRGRVDESTVLVDIAHARAYASTWYGAKLGVPDVTSSTWRAGRPATLHLDGVSATRDVALPGALRRGAAPNRCP